MRALKYFAVVDFSAKQRAPRCFPVFVRDKRLFRSVFVFDFNLCDQRQAVAVNLVAIADAGPVNPSFVIAVAKPGAHGVFAGPQ